MDAYKTILRQEKRLNKQFSCKIGWLCTLNECIALFKDKSMVYFMANGDLYEFDSSNFTYHRLQDETEAVVRDLFQLTVEIKCRGATYFKLWYNGSFECDCVYSTHKLPYKHINIKSLACKLKNEDILQEVTEKYVVLNLDI